MCLYILHFEVLLIVILSAFLKSVKMFRKSIRYVSEQFFNYTAR